MTNEQIQKILDGAPEGATDFCNGNYNDKDGRVFDGFEGRFIEEDYPYFGMPLETYREILELRQEVERLEAERDSACYLNDSLSAELNQLRER